MSMLLDDQALHAGGTLALAPPANCDERDYNDLYNSENIAKAGHLDLVIPVTARGRIIVANASSAFYVAFWW